MKLAKMEVGLKINWKHGTEYCQDPLSISHPSFTAHLLHSFSIQNSRKHGYSSCMVLQSLGRQSLERDWFISLLMLHFKIPRKSCKWPALVRSSLLDHQLCSVRAEYCVIDAIRSGTHAQTNQLWVRIMSSY